MHRVCVHLKQVSQKPYITLYAVYSEILHSYFMKKLVVMPRIEFVIWSWNPYTTPPVSWKGYLSILSYGKGTAWGSEGMVGKELSTQNNLQKKQTTTTKNFTELLFHKTHLF